MKKTDMNILALFEQTRPLFVALGDETRQQIIMQLIETHKLSVNEITLETSLSRPAISHHLKILRTSGLVSVERRGTQRFYYLADTITVQVDLLEKLALTLRTLTRQ